MAMSIWGKEVDVRHSKVAASARLGLDGIPGRAVVGDLRKDARKNDHQGEECREPATTCFSRLCMMSDLFLSRLPGVEVYFSLLAGKPVEGVPNRSTINPWYRPRPPTGRLRHSALGNQDVPGARRTESGTPCRLF